MEMIKAFSLYAFAFGAVVALVRFVFYAEKFDPYADIRNLSVRQSPNTPLISLLAFNSLKREVRGGNKFLGSNEEVLCLLYPKRYFYYSLFIFVHLSAAATALSLLIRIVEEINSENLNKVFFAQDGNVHPLIVVAFTSLLLFVITCIVGGVQRRAYIREIREYGTTI